MRITCFCDVWTTKVHEGEPCCCCAERIMISSLDTDLRIAGDFVKARVSYGVDVYGNTFT